MAARIRTPFLSLAITFGLFVRPAAAQAPDCTYDRCALRLQHGFLSTRLVQGAGATPLRRIGLFAPRIDVLASAHDSARLNYEAFRSSRNAAGILQVLVAAAFTASIAVASCWNCDNTDAFIGLSAVSITLSIPAQIHRQKSADHLQRAIWFYNRGLSPPP